ncbi:hypothetical protein RD792_017234 [Penstemon davidsonii]|uniref:SAGA-associated factor 11 n=1 Tax=Penstemon davidsonii TaxID=160366 RepID=A0ABR0CLN6_9LAMI|nr:hypothetical protein RD792_017234 [Penstemon davidsonii]
MQFHVCCGFALQLSSDIFRDILDSIIVDVASESHRIARLGLDRNLDLEEEELRLSAEARARASDPSHSGEANGKYVVDIFGQSHPAIANEIFDCMNCGRSIMAGRFAPHLEKCMGKVTTIDGSPNLDRWLPIGLLTSRWLLGRASVEQVATRQIVIRQMATRQQIHQADGYLTNRIMSVRGHLHERLQLTVDFMCGIPDLERHCA